MKVWCLALKFEVWNQRLTSKLKFNFVVLSWSLRPLSEVWLWSKKSEVNVLFKGLKCWVEVWSLKLKFKAWSWCFDLDVEVQVWFWLWKLCSQLAFEVYVWSSYLKLMFEFEFKFEVQVWS